MVYFTFLPRQLLGYELEEKQYNIFPPFLLVTEKLVKKLMGERKMVGIFFPFPYISPMDHAVFGSQTVTVLRCMKMMIFTLGQGFGSGSVSGSAWIRINLSCWIRIRIQIADPDPDPGGQKWPTKIGKITEFSCFEVLDVLF
jgi:hypothetical protein